MKYDSGIGMPSYIGVAGGDSHRRIPIAPSLRYPEDAAGPYSSSRRCASTMWDLLMTANLLRAT